MTNILDKFQTGEVQKGSIVDFEPERDMKHLDTIAGQLVCKSDEHNPTHPKWCIHIQRTVLSGADAEFIMADFNLIVPVFPSVGIHAQVNIEPPFGGGGVDPNQSPAMMALRFSPEIGRPYSVPLGFWNPGEGRASIRMVIIDYLKSGLEQGEDLVTTQLKPMLTRCPSSTHGIKEQRWLDHPRGLGIRQATAWNIVMEKACTACMNLTGSPDDNFGIDDSVTTKPRWK